MMGVPGNLLTLQLRILLAKNTIANGLSVFIFFARYVVLLNYAIVLLASNTRLHRKA